MSNGYVSHRRTPFDRVLTRLTPIPPQNQCLRRPGSSLRRILSDLQMEIPKADG